MRFDLVLSRTNYPGLAPRVGQLAVPLRPILPAAALVAGVDLAANVVAAKLAEAPRQWRQSSCPAISGATLVEAVQQAGPPPAEWLETGLGIVGQWGTVSLASMAAAALAGATVAPAAVLVAGGAALVGTVGSLALSAARQTALEAREQTIQLSPSRELELLQVDGGICVYELPEPAPPALSSSGGDAVAAVPEWWPTRPGADRPQLVLLFARVKEDGKVDRSRTRVITIPHFVGEEPPEQPPVGTHRRGPWLVELTLLDNSKLRVFASSPEEGLRVLAEARALVNPEFDDPEKQASIKKMESDTYYQEYNVKPIRATLFPRGQRVEEEGGRPIVRYYDGVT